MSVTESRAAVTPKLCWFQCSLRGLLIATAIVSLILGYAVTYGPGVAIVLGILALLAWLWVVRACRRWKQLLLRQRFYASVEGGIILTLLIAFLVSVAVNSSLACQRNALSLKRAFWIDDRFRSIHVEYCELKVRFLCVEGSVHSERDFDSLRKIIDSYEWRDMHDVKWSVRVESSGREHEGWDSELFDAEDRGPTHRSRRASRHLVVPAERAW